MDLFEETEEDDFVGLRTLRSRESLDKTQVSGPRLSRTGASAPSSPRLSPRLPPSSPGLRSRSPWGRQRNGAEPPDSQSSPLARIFARRPLNEPDIPEGGVASAESMEGALAGIRKVERMVEGISDLPVGRLRAEMKELQVRHLSRCRDSPLTDDLSSGATSAHRESSSDVDEGYEGRYEFHSQRDTLTPDLHTHISLFTIALWPQSDTHLDIRQNITMKAWLRFL
jgi:hypothetical protein